MQEYKTIELKELKELRTKVETLEITNQNMKKSELELTEENELINRYFNAALVMIVVIDRNANIIKINRRSCEVLGYRKEELLGKNWFDTCIPLNIRDSRKKFYKELMTGKSDRDEYFEIPVG